MVNALIIQGAGNIAPQIPVNPSSECTREGGSFVSNFEFASVTSLTVLGGISQVGGQLGHIAAKIKEVAAVFAVVAGYISGVTNLVTGAFEAYWLIRKVSFHSKINKGIKQANNTEEKAQAIWKVYSSFFKIDEASINKEISKLSGKSLEEQGKSLWKTYDDEINGWGDYFGNIGYKIKAYIYKKFGQKYALKNLVKERHETIKADREAFIDVLLNPSLKSEDKAILIANKKRELLVKRAERSQLAALEKIVSPTFAHELYMNKGSIDLSKVEHQEALVALQGRVSTNYKANLCADVLECVGHLAIGIIGIASMVFVKVAALKIVISTVSGVVTMRTVYKATNALRKLFGAELPKTFAEDTYKLFEVFKVRELTLVNPGQFQAA